MRKVLVVDGAAAVRERVGLALGDKTHLLMAGSRREALAYACVEEVDVALVGVTDPVEDALDLVHALIEIRPDLRLLLLVDRHLQRAVSPLFAEGIIDTLPRTFDPQALVASLGGVVHGPPPEPAASEISNLKSRVSDPIAETPSEGRCPPLGGLAAELSHRLKNPLVSISTFARLLNDRYDDPSFRQDFYHLTIQEVEKIDQAIGLLTAFANLPPPQPQACDVRRLVEEAFAAESDALIRAGVTVEISIVRGIPSIMADPYHARYIISLMMRAALAEGVRKSTMIWSAATGSRSGPEGSPMIELQLLYPGPPPNPHIRGLEAVLAELALTPFTGSIEIERRPDGRRAVRLLFPASSSEAGVPESETLANLLLGRRLEFSFQNRVDRRIRLEAIAFSDRRIEERRREPAAILAKDRRRIMGTFEEVVS